MSHSPGPWYWVSTPSAHSLDYPVNSPDKSWDGSAAEEPPPFDELRAADGSSVLAGVWCNDTTAEIWVKSAADARLIIAAPAMLVALRAFVAVQSHEECGCEFAESWNAARAAIAKAEPSP